VSVAEAVVPPFRIQYELTRRPRLAAYLHVWGPCLAPCLGFTLGIAFLSLVMTPWFLALLAVPAGLGWWYLPGLLDIARHPTEPVELAVDAGAMTVVSRRTRLRLPLDGIVQVFRAGDFWTALHANAAPLHIPAGAITDEQADYLKGFALRAAAARRAATLSPGGAE
jgi:hypothetical protein